MTTLDSIMQNEAAQRSAMAAKASNTRGRRGMAFIIEALFLVVFLAACSAVFMQLLGLSGHMSEDSLQMNAAVRAATNAAEEFSYDPVSFEAPESGDDLQVLVDVQPERVGNGVLYHATIVVLDASDQEIYQLQTARFVAGRANG